MINSILTKRNHVQGVFWDIVFEWENIICDKLQINLEDDSCFANRYLNNLARILPSLKTSRKSLSFVMAPFHDPATGNRRILPCIIDFYLRDKKELSKFYRRFSRNKCVLISSKEAYDFLKQISCPLNIRHWAISVPDSILQSSPVDEKKPPKQYDVILMGRQNPVLRQYFDAYIADHPDVRYLTRYSPKEQCFFYRSSDGNEVYPCNTYKEYISLMMLSRIGLYSTPSMDGSNKNSAGFNQVTPRFLEFAACGCHIIARYPKNPDTEYFEMDNLCTKIDSYDDFEKAMNSALKNEVDMNLRMEYLKKHMTSTRAKELAAIADEEGF